MRDLNHDFKLLCQRNRDGSMATQHDREVILSLVADHLHEGGFHHLLAQGMRTKHIDYLVELIISRELGHEREQITAVYLGR